MGCSPRSWAAAPCLGDAYHGVLFPHMGSYLHCDPAGSPYALDFTKGDARTGAARQGTVQHTEVRKFILYRLSIKRCRSESQRAVTVGLQEAHSCKVNDKVLLVVIECGKVRRDNDPLRVILVEGRYWQN